MERVEMKKKLEASQLIKKLREDHGYSTQKAFADALGLGQTVVSAWETGDNVPSSEAWVKIGNLLPYPDNVRCFKRAGIKPLAMLSAAAGIMAEQARAAEPFWETGTVVPVRRFREILRGREKAGPDVPLPSEFLPNPDSTICLVVDRKAAEVVVDSPRAIFILDESCKGAPEPGPSDGHVVFVEHESRAASIPGQQVRREIYMGRLRFVFYVQPTAEWKFHASIVLTSLVGVPPYRKRVIGGSEYSAQNELAGLDPFDPEIAAHPRVVSARNKARELALTQIELAPGWSLLGRVLGRFHLEGQRNE